MIVIHLLVLGVRGRSPDKYLAKPVLERAVKDDEEGFEECLAAEVQNWTSYFTMTGEIEPALWVLLAKCCARFPASEVGVEGRKVCGENGKERKEWIEVAGEQGVKAFCDTWCEEASAAWCSSGASVGATVGIVIAVMVVGAAITGILIYFLVIRKRGDQEFKEMNS
jgi:hypothetical protein